MKNNVLLEALFPARGRRDLLRVLFSEQGPGSASELGRRAGVSPKTALFVLKEFAGAGLATYEGRGNTLLFRRAETPAANALASVLREAATAGPAEDESLEPALAFYGAPLLRAKPMATLGLEDALARAAKRSRSDSTLFRVLPVVLARNAGDVDWTLLRDRAQRFDGKAEMGLLVEMTGELLGRKDVTLRARAFKDGRRQPMRHYFEPRNEFEEKLAVAKTPATAKKWRFWMNMDVASLRSTLERHG